MNTTNTKTVLLMSDPPNNFEIRNITLRILKTEITDMKYTQYTYKEFLYPRKENM